MKKPPLLVLAVAALLVMAQAQSNNKKMDLQPATTPTNNATRQIKVDEVVVLRAQNAKLKQQVEQLQKQIEQLKADAVKAKAALPHCSNDLRTSASGQGSRNCAPYNCDQVTGACMQICATTEDCQLGTVCDMGTPGRCVRY